MRISDEISGANAQLKLATKTQGDLNRAQKESYAIAQKQGVAYSAMATLYAKSTKAATSMGMGMDQAMKMGEGATAAIAAGIRASGTSSEAAKAGVFQLSQALASGVLRGDELNSVMENIPAVGDAIAVAMGKSAGELRRMGKEGELTSKAVVEGLNKARPELERLAAMIPLTFGGAFTKVKNAFGQLLTKTDGEVGFGKAIVAGMEVLAKALDFLATHSQAISNLIVGALVGMAYKVAAAHTLAAGAARRQATANVALAATAHAAARAQQAQALSSLAVARSMAAQGASGGGAAVGAAAANLANANRALAGTRAASAAASTALAGATARSGLFGAALVRAGVMGRAAIAMIGGPIGVVIAAIVGLILWAGKAALSFKPIAGEAATVGDYVAEAFEYGSQLASDALGKLGDWASQKMGEIGKVVRKVAVYIVDAFLSAARGAAGAASGVAAAWTAMAGNVASVIAGMKSDAGQALQGNFTAAGTKAALAGGKSVGAAFSGGVAEGMANTFAGVSGESVVKGVEIAVGNAKRAVIDGFKNSRFRKGANERARMRALKEKGGAQDPGTPSPATEDKGDKDKNKKDKPKKDKDERTFEDILTDAREEAKLAGIVSYERDRQSAIIAAQKELKRGLTGLEEQQLRAAIALKQTNEANLSLTEKTKDVMEAVAAARVTAAADAATVGNNPAMAIALEAENAVQQELNAAKRAGVVLDAAKVEAYRNAVQLAAIETQQVKAQTEAKQALKEIADNARQAIQSAVSDAIYAGLSGDIKGVKGLFKSIGNVFKKAMAEQITLGIFGSGNKVDGGAVTKAAVDIAAPAAKAVVAGAYQITNAMSEAADAIRPGGTGGTDPLAPLADGVGAVTSTLVEGAGAVQSGIAAVTSVFQNGAGGIAGVIGGIIGTLGKLLGIGGGAGGPAGGPAGVLGKLSPKLDKLIGTLAKGAMFGQMGAAIGKSILGGKGSATGGALGGMAGQLAGQAIGKAVGGALGSALGPIGGMVGGMIGSAVFGMMKKTKSGSVTLNSEGVADAQGNDKASKKNASVAGNAIIDKLKAMAKSLGAGVGDFGNITIGQRHGDWRVNTGGGSLKKKKGAKEFDDDAEGALAYAIEQAIKRGAFTGLTAGVSEAIKSGRASVEEAVSFLSEKKKIDRSALALVDPIAAAVADVDDEYRTLLDQYKLFGESTVNLEKVYLDARRKAVETGLQDQLAGVRNLMAEIKGGSVGGASVSDRVSEQSRLFSAIEAAQRSGGAVNYDQINTVGRALLDATRELEGSTPEFYAQVNRVMAVLESAIAGGSNPTVSVLPTPLDFGNAIAPPIVGGLVAVETAINSGFTNLLTGLNNQSQAIVRGDAATVEAVHTLNPRDQYGGGGGGGRGGSNYNVRSF